MSETGADEIFAPLTQLEKAEAPRSMLSKQEKWIRMHHVPHDQISAFMPSGNPTAKHHYYDEEGNIEQIVCRYQQADGEKIFTPYTFCEEASSGKREWRKKAPEGSRSLYRLREMLAKSDAVVIVTEGEKAADAVVELQPDYVAVTSSGGANASAKTDWSPLKGRYVVIWGDNDSGGRKYAKQVQETLLRVGVQSLSVVTYDDGFSEKWDAADALAEGWNAQKVIALLNSAKDVPIETIYPPYFNINDQGVFYLGADDDSEPMKLCSPLEIIAHTHDGEGENHGLLLRWKTPRSGVVHQWAMPMRLLAGDGTRLLEHLFDLGLIVHDGRKIKARFMEFLKESQPVKEMQSVSRIGWSGEHYVLPDAIFPKTDNKVLQMEQADYSAFQTKGTLEQWKNCLAQYAEGNSRVVFALSCAFAAVMLKYANGESGGFHFIGDSSVGKTTLLQVAASVWGGNDNEGFIGQWRTTSNALEKTAATRNDSLLLLDELGQVDGKEVASTVYMLGNNQGKKRMNSDAALRKSFSWRTLLLSSGEIPLDVKIQEAGGRVYAGLDVRFVGLYADAGLGWGIFEKMYEEFGSSAEFSDYLKSVSKQYYGTPIRAFLAAMVQNLSEYVQIFNQHRRDFRERMIAPDYDGQVQRVAERFAVVAAGGQLAIQLGILPLSECAADEAAVKCFHDWLAARGTHGKLEDSKIIEQVRLYLEKFCDNRFSSFSGEVRGERAGWKEAHVSVNGQMHDLMFYITSEVFRREVCKGLDYKRVEGLLIHNGLLIPDANGSATRPKAVNGKKMRLYWISNNLLS